MKNLLHTFFLITVLAGCTSSKYSNLKDGIYAEIQTNKGNILLELYAENTPMTVANFVSLVEGTNSRLSDSLKGKNFYEGLIFHRVVPNFVIQGGGFNAQGRKKPGYVFGDEFPKKEDGDLLYRHDDQGVFSMANGGPKTNNSQFFITHRPIPHLDGKHSVFGKTIVNPTQLKELKNKFKDSLQLRKAVDSLRMVVVNNIVQNDTIVSINIFRNGSKAQSFNASEVFDRELGRFAETEKELKKAEEAADRARYSQYLEDKEKFLIKMDEPKATKTSSGLRILKIKSNPSGKKVVDSQPTTINYILSLADGKKIQSTYDKNGKPFTFTLNDPQRPMITGFKEGLLSLREGEKVRLFIPYYIAYGEDAFGPFPKKADIVFEIEVLKVGK
jgi:cyclophilin family peptidyl-prolyl cis-trans isomerase